MNYLAISLVILLRLCLGIKEDERLQTCGVERLLIHNARRRFGSARITLSFNAGVSQEYGSLGTLLCSHRVEHTSQNKVQKRISVCIKQLV
jgi:hypothetical protein